MGDRTNPIKFGPEWLRNLAREPSNPGGNTGQGRDGAGSGRDGAGSGRDGAGSGRDGAGSGPPGVGAPGGGSHAQPNRCANANPNTNTTLQNTSKVLLAKLRYGREEMLALYDSQTAEAPAQLRSIDTLYQAKGKPPYALNTFEDDTRDNMRGPPPMGGLPPSERYTGVGRGRTISIGEVRGGGLNTGDVRGRARGYNRQTSLGRGTPGWHGNPRNSYAGMPDDDPNQQLRQWNNSTNPGSSGLRPTNLEQQEWQNKQQPYRNKRLTNTNWRQQQNRDDGEEWRSAAADGARRPQEKWEWEWAEARGRPNQEKWHSNRRTWVGGDNNEDALPEWAVDNAEACGGTFDSSGAFHGYSNDDTNLPKNPESPYPLTRSHTHGSFVRSKTIEEGSDEWWASEKAKKLSPKRFDASEIKFKQPSGQGNAEETPNTNTAGGAASNANGHSTGAIPKNYRASGDRALKDSKPGKKSGSKEKDDDSPENKVALESEENKLKQLENTSKEKTFEPRSNSSDKQNEDKNNFQSVILTSNNTLRQKHQNFVGSPTDSPKRQPGMQVQFFENANQARQFENDADTQKEKENNKLVDDILQMSMDDAIPSASMNQLLTNHSSSALNSLAQLPNSSMQARMPTPLQALGLNAQNAQNIQPSHSIQTTGAQSSRMQIGITNSMLNASLGLPMPNSSTGLPIPGMPPSLPNSGLSSQSILASALAMGGGSMQPSGLQPGGMQAASLQRGQTSGLQVGGMQMSNLQGNGMQHVTSLQANMQASGLQNNAMQAGGPMLPGFQSSSSVLPGMGNNSLFNNMQNTNNLPNHGGQNMYPMHEMQQPSSQSFNNSLYGNMMSQPPPTLPNMGMQHMSQQSQDEWYYEDPNKTIQGPFTAKEMFNWYRAGFFSPSLMVSRGCDRVMRPLGSYGHMPFGHMDLLPPFPMSGGFDLRHQQDNLLPQQPGLGIDMESLWGQPSNNTPAPNDLMWMQAMNNNSQRNENRINNLPLYFWDNQPNMPSTPLLPEEMKTEEEIIAQMRAAQAAKPPKPPSPLSFLAELPTSTAEDSFVAPSANLDMDQLQKLIRSEDKVTVAPDVNDSVQQKVEKAAKDDQQTAEAPVAKPQSKTPDPKPVKEVKGENKLAKAKDNPTKPKTKTKAREDKKEESTDSKTKEEEVKAEKRSAEPSPSPKNKKEDKSNKKDLEKEKKEWIKEGFTIVKGAEKNKDSKKKTDEAKSAEEVERKRKEEEKIAAEEKKRQSEIIKKQQEAQNQQPAIQRLAAESVSKKAPWSASSQELQSSTWEGPTLAEIQRLEREKKLEQMKEQHQMMQLIAHQQAASLAREQEMQGGLGWAKKPTTTTQHQTLAEIQAEARAQAAAAAAAQAAQAAAIAREEVQATPPPVNSVPWGNSTQNGGAGFWDCPPVEPVKPFAKPADPPKSAEPRPKKKVTVMIPPKPENTPSVEFDMWCTNILDSWRDSSVDIPTFVAFLREIESPYEVRDYVKCYLGESREASEFAGQFLERRSRLLRVGMVTPSDDLCSPAMAINPRTNSGSDYTEVKGKAKKIKKNKMLKVDARAILGFSVTASEDRINVGDIDTV